MSADNPTEGRPMARHSKGENNIKLAGWVWAVIILAILALVGAILYFTGNSDDNANDAASTPAAETTAVATETTEEATTTDAPTSETDAPSSESEEATESESSTAESTTSAAPQGVAGAENTLILFDTSDSMGGIFAPVSNSLADTARELGAEGKQVAVWNYSSPLTPGVTVGYRSNLSFGSADEAANTVIRFGTGGVPQSRSAVVAAVANASDYANETGQPARVLLVTTGTAQDMDDAAFKEAFNAATQGTVELSVVHVGSGDRDTAIEDVATTVETAADASDRDAVRAALEKAAGA